MSNILSFLNPVNILVWLTFLYGLYFLNLKKTINKWLLLILGAYALHEILTIVFIKNDLKLYYYKAGSIEFLLSQTAWLFILKKEGNYSSFFNYVIMLFIFFCVLDFLCLEANSFNSYAFIIGALLYVIFFIYESYYQLNKENLPFFKTNEYILLFAPILYFLAFSVIFGFKSKLLNATLFANLEFYDIVCNFINYILYGCILYYIYKDNKSKI